MSEVQQPIRKIEDGETPAKRVAPSIQLGAEFKWNLQALSAAADAVQCGGKSPVSALNELGVSVTYSVRQQSGPVHCPSFNVCVTVADMVFEGAGHSKREARASAARACLAALLARAGRVLPPARAPTDFAQDDVTARPGSEFQCLEAKNRLQGDVTVDTQHKPETNGRAKPAPPPPTAPPPAAHPAPDSRAASLFGAPAAPLASKSPINLLYENYPGLVFNCTFGDGTPLDTQPDGETPAKRVAPSIQLGAEFKWNLQALSAAADAVQCGGKSPVSALNELGVSVTYSVRQQSGPVHCPSFNVCVTVADMVFEGAGHSKREARASAARACLAALLARAGRVLPPARAPTDFAQDDVTARPGSEFQCLEAKNRLQGDVTVDTQHKPETNGRAKPAPPPPTAPPPAAHPAPDSRAASLFGAPAAPLASKSPINLLYENYPGLVFNCTFGDGTPLDTQPDGETPAKRVAPSIQLGAEFKWNLQALSAAADAVQCGGKSPVSALNELGVSVTYSVRQQSGPVHCPSFNVCVTVADMVFEGAGHSKREARASAARACLAALLARAGRVLPPARAPTDFAQDDVTARPGSEFQCLEAKNRLQGDVTVDTQHKPETNGRAKPAPPPPTAPPPAAHPAPDSRAASLFGAPAAPLASKSPINLLYENYPGLVFNCTFGDGTPLDTQPAPAQLSHSMRFKVVCQINEQNFEGYGSSKKLAKLAAARAALATLDEGRGEGVPASAAPGTRDILPQTLADYVSKLVNERFNELMREDLIHSKRKVLAGIVITIDNQIEGAKLIGVTTGTKCVSGEHMSVRGRALNDCHAEVAARRCLQRHLYTQLAMYALAADPRRPIPESDIEPAPGGGYRLKPSRGVHLYVSTAPCGDGRIFSPHEQPQPQPDKHPNRLARGQLRTKIESGEGTIPVKNSSVIQTWDGVLQGERLLTMSCSDKVARWCVLGLQGSLLSLFLQPVYLQSLVLGSLLHPAHLYRAICGRFENSLSGLPPPFALQRPMLAKAASAETRSPARAPSFSVCWYATDKVPEIVNAMTGKLENGQPSLLCKQSMFARWQYLLKRLAPLPQSPEVNLWPNGVRGNCEQLLYAEAKQLCPVYQAAKERLFEAFAANKLGRWVKKPLEQEQFVCELLGAEPGTLFA